MPQNVAIEEIGEVWSFPDEASPDQISAAITGQLSARKPRAEFHPESIRNVPGISREVAALNPNAAPFDFEAAKEDTVNSLAQGGIGLQQGFHSLGEQGWTVIQGITEPIIEVGPFALTASGPTYTPATRAVADFSRETAKEARKSSESLMPLARETGGSPFMRTLGQAIPSVAPALATGPLGLPAVLASAGLQGGAATLSEVQSQFEQAPLERRKNFMPNQEFWDAMGPAAADAIQTATVTAIFGKLFGPGIEGATLQVQREAVKQTVGKAAKEVVGESLEESTNQLLSDYVIAKMSYNPEVKFSEAVKQAVEAGVAGGLIGGALTTSRAIAETSQVAKTGEALRAANAPATAAVAEEIGLPLLTTEEIGREVAPLTAAQAEAGLAEALPEGPEAADIRILAQPSAQRISAAEAEAGLREVLPDDPTTDIRRAPKDLTLGSEKVQGGGNDITRPIEPENLQREPARSENVPIESNPIARADGEGRNPERVGQVVGRDQSSGRTDLPREQGTEGARSASEGTGKPSVAGVTPQIIERINARDRRDWSKVPSSFELSAVRAAFNDAKELFPKKAIGQRVRASKATTFKELREAVNDALQKFQPELAQPLNPGGSLKSLSPDLQARSNAVKEQMRAEFEGLKKKEAEKPTITTARQVNDSIFVHFDKRGGKVPTAAELTRQFRDAGHNVEFAEFAQNIGSAAADTVRFKGSAMDQSGASSSRVAAEAFKSVFGQSEPIHAKTQAELNIPAEERLKRSVEAAQPIPKPSATTEGRVRIKGRPSTYVITETLPQTELEKSEGDQFVRIKNEQTGETEIIPQDELIAVKDKTEAAKPKRTKSDLNKALKEAGLDPSVFKNAAQKKNALKRAAAKIKELQDKIQGSRATIQFGIAKQALLVVLDAVRLSLDTFGSIQIALEAGIAKARELLGDGNFNEDELREQITTELTKSERKETQSTTFTGEYETSSRSRQIIAAEQFAEGKTPEQVIDAIALLAAGKDVPGLSRENVKATLVLTMKGLFEIVVGSANPIEANTAAALIDRAKSLFQQGTSLTGQELESAKVAQEQLSYMAPWLAYRGLAKQSWAKALQLAPEVDPTKINPVTGSGTQAGQEVQKDIDSLNADAALMKAIKESGVTLSELFLDNDRATQAQRRKHLFEQIRQKFPNLTTDQKLKLEKALMEAWEKARLKVIRAQFKKFVGLPEVAAENIVKELQPELIRQANLGTLDDEAFRAALARKLKLPEINGETARELTKLAQDAQAAPEGVVRNKILQRMVDAIQASGDFDPWSILMDSWFASVLSGTKTMMAVGTGSILTGTVNSALLALNAATTMGNPKLGAQIMFAYVLDLVEGVANAVDVVRTGDVTRRAEFADNINAVLQGKGRMDSLEGMKKFGNRWQKLLGQQAYVRRAIVGLDYIGAIAARGSGILFNAALTSPEQLELAQRRFNKKFSQQAKAQAQAELGKGAKWVDVRARQLEILEEGITYETQQRAKVIGEIAALNAPPIGATGAAYGLLEKLAEVMAGKYQNDREKSRAAALGLKAVAGLAFARAGLNAMGAASNFVPFWGSLNFIRAQLGTKVPKNKFSRFFLMYDENGNPVSEDRRRLILLSQMIGVATATALLAKLMADDDDEEGWAITGSLRNFTPSERRTMNGLGIHPYMITFNKKLGKWVSWKEFPIGGAFSVPAEMMDKARKTQEMPEFDTAAKALTSLANSTAMGMSYLKDLSMVRGLAQVANISSYSTEEDLSVMNRMFAQSSRAATGLIPFSSLLREADTWPIIGGDPKIYRPSAPADYWIASLPFARREVGEGPEYNAAGLPIERMATPDSRFVRETSKEPVTAALVQLALRGVMPKFPMDSGYIQNGEKKTAKQLPAFKYKYEATVLQAWHEIMLPDAAEIAKMTRKEYEAYYQKHLAPVAQVIHDDIQDELDPEVLSRKRSKTGNRSVDPRYEMKGEE